MPFSLESWFCLFMFIVYHHCSFECTVMDSIICSVIRSFFSVSIVFSLYPDSAPLLLSLTILTSLIRLRCTLFPAPSHILLVLLVLSQSQTGPLPEPQMSLVTAMDGVLWLLLSTDIGALCPNVNILPLHGLCFMTLLWGCCPGDSHRK